MKVSEHLHMVFHKIFDAEGSVSFIFQMWKLRHEAGIAQ